MKILYHCFIITCLSASLYGQPGCTDPLASNFNPSAISNDGSCVYPPSNLPIMHLNFLDTLLNESSGLIYINDQLWSHVDNSDTNLYNIDSVSGSIIQEKRISQNINTDWEDVTKGNNFVFIGDFGNNSGSRTDLNILRFPVVALTDTTDVVPDMIGFVYEDQVDFTPLPFNNSFDCEAFVYYDDSLHLFTKDWINKFTKHYVLPAVPGNHVAMLVDSHDVNGLITSASIQDDGTVALLGYDNTGFGPCFIWLLYDYHGSSFFSGNKRMLSLGTAAALGQLEAITFRSNNYGYLTNELFQQSIINVPAQLWSFDFSQYLTSIDEDDNPENEIEFFQQQLDNSIRVEFTNTKHREVNYIITDTVGKKVKGGKLNREQSIIGIEELITGNYFLVLFAKGKKISTFNFIRG